MCVCLVVGSVVGLVDGREVGWTNGNANGDAKGAREGSCIRASVAGANVVSAKVAKRAMFLDPSFFVFLLWTMTPAGTIPPMVARARTNQLQTIVSQTEIVIN